MNANPPESRAPMPPDANRPPTYGPNVDRCRAICLESLAAHPKALTGAKAGVSDPNLFLNHLDRLVAVYESPDRFAQHLGLALRIGRRDVAGLTQQSMARSMAAGQGGTEDISQSYFSKLEQRANPFLARLGMICAVLGLPPSMLVMAAEVSYLLQEHSRLPEAERTAVVSDIIRRFAHETRETADGILRGRPAHQAQALAEWVAGNRDGRPADLAERFCAQIAWVLRLLRKAKGLTQAQVVQAARDSGQDDLTDFGETYLSQIENGVAHPTLHRLGFFARTYKVSLPALFARAELWMTAPRSEREVRERLAEDAAVVGRVSQQAAALNAMLADVNLPPARREWALKAASVFRTLDDELRKLQSQPECDSPDASAVDTSTGGSDGRPSRPTRTLKKG